MTAQREPFVDGLEPFVQGSEPGTASVVPNVMLDVARTVTIARRSVKLSVELPASLGYRLEHIVREERRMPSVVKNLSLPQSQRCPSGILAPFPTRVQGHSTVGREGQC